jgi:hypothetical protein
MNKDGLAGNLSCKIFFRIIYYEKAEGEGSMLLKTNNTMKGFV